MKESSINFDRFRQPLNSRTMLTTKIKQDSYNNNNWKRRRRQNDVVYPHYLNYIEDSNPPSKTKPIIKILLILSILMILLKIVSCVVVYKVRFIATKTGRTDYALAGESIELSCHYIMKDEDEDIKQLVWSKDGKNFLKWRKHMKGLEVLDYTFKGHIDPSSKLSHLIINNVTIDMHGKYKCSIKTDLSTHENEQNLIIISETNCKLNDWRVNSQPTQCRELFRLDCRNMFPKPEPSCGLWNGKLDKFIRSVQVDISEELNNNKTYRIKYNDKFELIKQISSNKYNLADQKSKQKKFPEPGSAVSAISNATTNSSSTNMTTIFNSDLLQYAGHLIFKCDISVPETSWKLSLVHRMFDYNDACLQDPLEAIERMRHNYSQYAAMKIQQDGLMSSLPSSGYTTNNGDRNSLDHHQQQQPHEFEMLTSNLKYQFFPPTFNPTKAVELNCWQKPKLGTLAKLSCATKSNHVKLIGANLLECRQNGWVPIISDSEITGSKSAHNRKSPRSGRRVSEQNNKNNTLVKLTTGNDEVISKKKIYHNEEDDDDDDDNNNDKLDSTIENDLDQQQQQTTEATTTIKSVDIEIIPRSQLEERINSNQEQQAEQLSSAQLASLLPTCVSTRRYQYPILITSGNSDRLPLIEGSSGDMRVLESKTDSLKGGRFAKPRGGVVPLHHGRSSSSSTSQKTLPFFYNNNRTNLNLYSGLVIIIILASSLHLSILINIKNCIII